MDYVKKTKIKHCPHCSKYFKYTEIGLSIINDKGAWLVKCSGCKEKFLLELENPVESNMNEGNYLIEQKYDYGIQDRDDLTAKYKVAVKEIVYNFDMNRQDIRFETSKFSIFNCTRCKSNLEDQFYEQLKVDFDRIKEQYYKAFNYLLSSNQDDCKYVIIQKAMRCDCGNEGIAKFYTYFRMNSNDIQQNLNQFLLADTDMSSLRDTINGVFTKSEAMDILEKLIMRWNLLFQKIVVATPFVGYKELSREKKIDLWEWILNCLDHEKAVFVTKTSTFNLYKNVLDRVYNIDYDLLKKYQLENKIISNYTKRNDFHAKFYAGISSGTCEILSGSLNIVKGPSKESIILSTIDYDNYIKKYHKPMKLPELDIQAVRERNVLISKGDSGEWEARIQ